MQSAIHSATTKREEERKIDKKREEREKRNKIGMLLFLFVLF